MNIPPRFTLTTTLIVVFGALHAHFAQMTQFPRSLGHLILFVVSMLMLWIYAIEQIGYW